MNSHASVGDASVPLGANHSNYLLVGWAFAVPGLGYLAVVLGGLTSGARVVFGHNTFSISISLIDSLACAILLFFALRRILVSRRDGVIERPLSMSERGAVAGFVLGVVLAMVNFRGAIQLGLLLAVFGWGPLGLVLCAVAFAWGSRLWREARPSTSAGFS